jgi:hypothetical protein
LLSLERVANVTDSLTSIRTHLHKSQNVTIRLVQPMKDLIPCDNEVRRAFDSALYLDKQEIAVRSATLDIEPWVIEGHLFRIPPK